MSSFARGVPAGRRACISFSPREGCLLQHRDHVKGGAGAATAVVLQRTSTVRGGAGGALSAVVAALLQRRDRARGWCRCRATVGALLQRCDRARVVPVPCRRGGSCNAVTVREGGADRCRAQCRGARRGASCNAATAHKRVVPRSERRGARRELLPPASREGFLFFFLISLIFKRRFINEELRES